MTSYYKDSVDHKLTVELGTAALTETGIEISFLREGDSAATPVVPDDLLSIDAAHTPGGVIELGADFPNHYRVDIPDEAFEDGASFVIISVHDTSGDTWWIRRFELIDPPVEKNIFVCRSSVSYDPSVGDGRMVLLVWLEKDGQLVTPTEASITLVNHLDETIISATEDAIGSQGQIRFELTNITIVPDDILFLKTEIVYEGETYVTGEAVNVWD